MNGDRYEALYRLFEQATSIERQHLRTFLEEVSQRSPEIYPDLVALLDGADADDGPIPRDITGHDEGFSFPEPVMPDEIGPYKILEFLGRGGMGLVYKAQQETPSRDVAIKVLIPSVFRLSEATLARFRLEIELLGRLQHPNIAQVFDGGTANFGHGPQPYFVMEYLAGPTILEHMQHGSMSLRGRLKLFQQVCDAAHHAHQRGIIHRDIKPRNIQVDSSGIPKLLDFGIAISSETRGRAPENEPTAPIGTPAFMSPEQVAGESKDVDIRTDVYALGVLLHVCLTGRAPAESLRLGQGAWKVGTDAAGDPEVGELQADVVSIIRRCTEEKREYRYPSVSELMSDIERFLTHRPVLAHSGNWVYYLKKTARRHRGVFWGATIGVLALATGLLAALLFAHRAAEARDQALAVSAVRQLQEQVERAESLWPARPSLAPEIESWISQSEKLIESRPLYEEYLQSIRGRGARDENGWSFSDYEMGWLHDSIQQLVSDLARFSDPENGLLAQARQRLHVAVTIQGETVDRFKAEWKHACDDIAADPVYQGLRIAPQIGLIPLRKDPESGLWEFWHWESGARVTIAGFTRKWDVREDSGLVMVLVPGGTFWMGAQRKDPLGDNFDLVANSNELPAHRVRVEPFLLSKYEMTQAQWKLLTGEEPSYFRPGVGVGGVGASLAHPIESVTWLECMRVLIRFGLTLPTEAQWEYAARAGTATPWWFGSSPSGIDKVANTGDAALRRVFYDGDVSLNDGFPFHAPVGEFAANPFGFHDILGNVFEWAQDPYFAYAPEDSPADDGRTSDTYQRYRIIRGGSYRSDAQSCRASNRSVRLPNASEDYVGVRPAMMLQPPPAADLNRRR